MEEYVYVFKLCFYIIHFTVQKNTPPPQTDISEKNCNTFTLFADHMFYYHI